MKTGGRERNPTAKFRGVSVEHVEYLEVKKRKQRD